jgi:hypothetical protein
MKRFTGWVMSAGLLLTAVGAAHAQVVAPDAAGRSPYLVASDVDGPYAAMPPEAIKPRNGPMLLPPQEVYTVLRENGFSPLGTPQQRGLFYTVAVIDRGGDDGRLVIDARDGRIIRFIPAGRIGGNFNEDVGVIYGPAAALPPMGNLRGVPRPPASVPRVASRTPLVPLPKASPAHAGEPKPQAAGPAPAPAQQSAAVQAKPAAAPTPPPAAASAPVQAAPAAPQILPTQEMPKVQGLD